MTHNSRYTVAIHMLTLLAFCEPDALTSEFIAGSVNTNPVVVRRLLASLREAGLVASKGGPGGGWHLLREPQQITLGAVFQVVEGGALFPLHASTPNPRCPIGKNIQEALVAIFREAQESMVQTLARTTLAQLLQDVKTLAS
jgi:Rrf2 family protein